MSLNLDPNAEPWYPNSQNTSRNNSKNKNTKNNNNNNNTPLNIPKYNNSNAVANNLAVMSNNEFKTVLTSAGGKRRNVSKKSRKVSKKSKKTKKTRRV